MTKRSDIATAMRGLIEATHSVSALVHVPVETLILAMLAAVKPEDAETLLEASKFYGPLRPSSNLVPDSPRYKHLLTLIERDNTALYKKLTNLD